MVVGLDHQVVTQSLLALCFGLYPSSCEVILVLVFVIGSLLYWFGDCLKEEVVIVGVCLKKEVVIVGLDLCLEEEVVKRGVGYSL